MFWMMLKSSDKKMSILKRKEARLCPSVKKKKKKKKRCESIAGNKEKCDDQLFQPS